MFIKKRIVLTRRGRENKGWGRDLWHDKKVSDKRVIVVKNKRKEVVWRSLLLGGMDNDVAAVVVFCFYCRSKL